MLVSGAISVSASQVKASGHVGGGDGQALGVEGERVLRHRGAVDRGRDELEVAAVEAQVGGAFVGAGRVAVEGDAARTRVAAGSSTKVSSTVSARKAGGR